jgi:hypothetical protein
VVADEQAPSCSCADYELNRRPCKHVYAVWAVMKGLPNEPIVEAEETPVVPKRPTYRQAWADYNKAKTDEKDLFQVLLFEMCRGIHEPILDRPNGGRPRLSLRDVVFAACFKAYCLFPGRQFMSDLRAAARMKYVTKAIHYDRILNYLEDTQLTTILRALVTVSSLPLKAVDVDFATDSTGFSTTRCDRWMDEKYGKPRRKARFVNVHLTVGVKTNIVTAAEIFA